MVTQEGAMDESFMYGMRGDPSAEFARKLEASLERQAREDAPLAAPRRLLRLTGFAAAVLLVAFAFSFPSVRAGAQSFLDLFRIVNFAAVPVDLSQMQVLHDKPLDLPHLIGDQVQVVSEPGPPKTFATPEAAGAALGVRVKLPSWTPVGWNVSQVLVTGEHSARIVASTAKLQQLLDALGVNDVQIPAGLDGKAASIEVPPVVAVTYRESDNPPVPGAPATTARNVTLLQARSPTVAFPAGVDLATLGEIGLRIFGLNRADAYRLAQSIDWRSTLIVPVPVDAASFRHVDVQGQGGLLIERRRQPGQRQPLGMNLLLWSSGNQVYALSGQVPAPTLLAMAQSIY
jgi:hypothetical protein